MATVGLHLLTLGLVDDDGKIIADANKGLSASGIYQVTSAQLGTKSAEITNLGKAGALIYGNDGAVDQLISVATPSVALDFNNLPFDITQKLLGRVSDGKGGYVPGAVPNVALMINTRTIGYANNIYWGFARGNVIQTGAKIDTNTQDEVRQDDPLTYQSFSVDKWNGQAVKVYYDGDTGFDNSAMLADVFGGYAAPATPAGH